MEVYMRGVKGYIGIMEPFDIIEDSGSYDSSNLPPSHAHDGYSSGFVA